MPIRSIEDVYKFLDAIPTFKAEGKKAADFSLEQFRKFCAEIGNPENQFDSIHVAGSNGKGSTCQLIASIYHHAGYNVGLYTSPHLIDYKERFTVNGEQIREKVLVEFFKTYLSLIKSFRLTYFEISTAVAFWWFARKEVDVAVIETGLGGRLDATNIITPLASAITTITLDHTDILGDTIEAIAAEKAGIIKPEVPVILGNVPEQAKEVIIQTAQEHKAPVRESTKLNPRWIDGKFQLTMDGNPIQLDSAFQAPVQAFNIALAWKITQVLQNVLPVEDLNRKEGIDKVGRLFSYVARFERLHPELQWYFDGAHNLQAVQTMKDAVETIQPVGQSVLVLSLMKDKITLKMMKEFLEFEKIIYHTLPLGRAASIKNIREWLPRVQSFPAAKKSRDNLLDQLESELVIFAGSFYFYSTVRDWVSSYKIDR